MQAAAATLATLFIIFDLLASGTAVLRLQSAVACSRRRRRREIPSQGSCRPAGCTSTSINCSRECALVIRYKDHVSGSGELSATTTG